MFICFKMNVKLHEQVFKKYSSYKSKDKIQKYKPGFFEF